MMGYHSLTLSHTHSHTHTLTHSHIQVGRPSDVWSLGCILYQLLYGKTPFDRYKKLHKLQAIIDSSVTISFPDIGNAAALDIMKVHTCTYMQVVIYMF